MWLHMPIITALVGMCRDVFGGGGGGVRYAYTTIPTYPSGQIGFMICRKGGGGGEREEKEKEKEKEKVVMLPPAVPEGLKYYHEALQEAAFVLPVFVRDALMGAGMDRAW